MKRDWRTKYPVKATYSNLRANARRRGKDFAITLEEFTTWIQGDGASLLVDGRPHRNRTIDRIDDTQGYVPGNLQVLDRGENARKRWVDFYRNQANTIGEPILGPAEPLELPGPDPDWQERNEPLPF